MDIYGISWSYSEFMVVDFEVQWDDGACCPSSVTACGRTNVNVVTVAGTNKNQVLGRFFEGVGQLKQRQAQSQDK